MKLKFTEVPILMYHEISDFANSWCVSPGEFARQMQLLYEQGYKTISLDELKKRVDEELEAEEKLVVITFDDARAGVYGHAYPLLKRYSFTATIYVVPQWIEGKNIPEAENFSKFLSWGQLKELAENGFAFGSHTYTHQNLTKVSKETLNEELELAEQSVQEKLNQQISHFSYPYGAFNNTVLDAVTNKYSTAVTVQKGFGKKQGRYARQWVLRDTSLEQFQRLLSPPTISLCMIVKNEEQILGQCLQSVKNLVDEIIIVDTGSMDKTKEIAKKFTNNIFNFSWNGDFSAARNESLRLATSNWVLILDADEVLDIEDHQEIKAAVNNWDFSGFKVITRNYDNDSSISGWQPSNYPSAKYLAEHSLSKSFQGWYPSLKIRLFQRKKEVQFQGKMHELVDEKELSRFGRIGVLRAPVHHYSQQKEKIGKTEQYLELTKQKIIDDSQDAKAYCELGIQYKQLGQFALAEENFQQSLQLDGYRITPRLNLAIVQQKQGKIEEAIQNYALILKKKASAEAYFGLGFCYFKKNELEESIKNFLSAVKYRPSFLDAYINLGAIYEKQKNYPEAIKFLRKALLINPQNARIYYNLGVVHEKRLHLTAAVLCYEKAIEFNYVRKEELEKRVEKMKRFLTENNSGTNPNSN